MWPNLDSVSMANLKSLFSKSLIIALFSVCVTGMYAQAITVAEALAIGNALAHNTSTAESYTIEGYVNVISENSFNTDYNNMTFWIADTRGTAGSSAAGALQVYRGRPNVELQVGDKVSVTAQIKRYYNTIETTPYNAPVTWLESGNVPTMDTIKGSLRICAQNLENYYVNYTESERPSYNTVEGFNEKTRKIVSNMLAIDADIYAFCEVEAKPEVLQLLADSMNAKAGLVGIYEPVSDNIDYDFGDGVDNHIKSGFIYRTDRVATVGSNTSAVYSGYYANTMRIQAFRQLSNGEKLVVSLNHFKAKDSSSDKGESMRITNANNLVTALGKATADPDILVLGDLNCEYGEEPLDIIMNAGFEEQILRFDSVAYSHCFDGGELIDHALANESMANQIVCAYVKHVSAYKCNASVTQEMSYSDHDPYVVEINLEVPEQPCEDLDVMYLTTGGSGLGDMTTESIIGQYNWRYQSDYGATCQDRGGEDWLMTPTYNFLEMSSVSIAFDHAFGYANSADITTQQTLWVTPNFTTVAGSEWHQLTIPNFPEVKIDGWSSYISNEINVPLSYVGANTVFGFKYEVPSDAATRPTWEIKNLHVTATCGESTAIDETTSSETKAAKRMLENG